MFRIPVLEWSSEDVKAWLKYLNVENRENTMDKMSGEHLLNISKVSRYLDDYLFRKIIIET